MGLLLRNLFRNFIEIAPKHNIYMSPTVTKTLSSLQIWEKKHHGDPSSSMQSLTRDDARKRLQEVDILVGELGIVEAHHLAPTGKNELATMQAGLTEYRQLLKEKYSEFNKQK